VLTVAVDLCGMVSSAAEGVLEVELDPSACGGPRKGLGSASFERLRESNDPSPMKEDCGNGL
jgi:hypothetical protein